VLRLPAPSGLGAQSNVLLSIRPEQLTLSAISGPELWRIEPGLSLPLGGQLVHEARTADGTTVKIAEPRLAALKGLPRLYCGLSPDARPSLFPRSPCPRSP
jgi:putative spermidine/putrescine transport system ATP-binding protein